MPNGEDIYATTKLLGTFGYFDPEYALVSIYFLILLPSILTLFRYLKISVS